MENYLLTNITISILMLICFALLKNSPARLRFYLLLTALFSWLLPWQKVLVNLPIDSIIPTQVSAYSQEFFTFMLLEANGVNNLSEQTSVESSATLINNTPQYITWFDGFAISLESVFILSLLIGLVLITKDIWLYKRQINHWLQKSTPLPNLFSKHQIQINNKEQHIPICLVEGCGPGMATGIVKPTIWLATYHYNTEHSKTIITHELNHIRQHDPLWMWLITLAQRLLWWNPIAYYLAKQAREQIELSCDERCAVELEKEYAYRLADLVLASTKEQQNFNPILGIKQSNNFNIKRLKRLSRGHNMKIKYLVATVITLTLSVFSALAINSTSVNRVSEQSTQANHVNEVKKHKRPKMKIYSEHHDHYNQLIDEVLVIAQQAKSNDKYIIGNIYAELYQWHNTREILAPESLEKQLKRLEFTLFNNLLTKLERYDEILSLYTEMFPERSTPAKFFKHHIALAYSHTGQADKAIELMTSFAHKQPLKHRVGSLSVLKYVYWAAENYQQVINTADKILILAPNKRAEISSLSAKYHAYNKLGEPTKADEVKNKLAQLFGKKPLHKPKSPIANSPFLDHVPDVKY